MTTPALSASITLQRAAAGRVGADRIALLRAIGSAGSIAAAAKTVGLSYKAAWDAVQVLNNLFDRPLVLAATGGRDGGATTLTPAGEAVVKVYAVAEAELAAVMTRLETGLADVHGMALKPLLWGIGMKTSARNALRGTVGRITPGVVTSEVVLTIADGVEIVATVTVESVADLGLAPGLPAIALVKSSSVILAPGADAPRTSARNTLSGTIVRREDGPVSSEITLELQVGKTLTATLTHASADALDLQVGGTATALVKASHVIVAVE